MECFDFYIKPVSVPFREKSNKAMEHVVSDQRKYKSMIIVFITCACVLLAGRVAGELSVIDNVVTIPDSDAHNTADGKNKDGETRVSTEHGDVRGHLDQSDILTYFDIPYGAFGEQQPFQEPTPPTPWVDVHDKSSHSSRCPQISEGKFEGNYECLTLTVMKQKDVNNADVLFHIHDNSFTSGSGDPAVYSPKYIVPKGVILILPNYRLGPLGFLCLQNSTAPGNAGLKDLTLALQWTQNNIEAFGGNSTNIVVSGGGAAGALVEFLLLSNSSNKFISKAITESGSALSPWAVDRNPLDTAKLFLRNLTKDEITMEPNLILQNIDLEVIMRAGEGIEFRPCVESENGFMAQSPWVTLQKAKFNFSYMTGSANQAAMTEVLALTNDNLSKINRNVTALLPNDLCFKNDNEELSVALKVKALYFGDHDIYENNREKLSLCFSDSQYLNGVIRAARLLARGGSQVYFYEFSLDNLSPFNGSARGDSLNFIFGTTDYDNIGTNKNIIRELMIHLWTSFIKYGIPEVENIEWNTLQYGEPAEERWLSIGSKVQMRSGLHADRLTLWNELYELHYVEGNWGYRHEPTAFGTIIYLLLLTYQL